MNRIITFQDLREFDFKNLWELKNPKFFQEADDTNAAIPQFKLRHSGSTLSFLTNYLTPSRLYGFRKFFAVPLWLFILLLIFATVYGYQTGSGDIGQIYFTVFFAALYLLLFINAGKARLRRWDTLYAKAVKTDFETHMAPAIIFDGEDMLLANERIFDAMGDRPIAAFVDDYNNQHKQKERQDLQAKKAAEKEKARIKKEKEDREFKEALEVVGPLIGGGIKSLVSEGGLSTRAAQAARGTTPSSRAAKAARGTTLSSRAARAARGTPPPISSGQDKGSASSIKIEGFTGSSWETCATGLDNNANYIATRMQQIRKSNTRYTKLRAVDSKGRVVDVG